MKVNKRIAKHKVFMFIANVNSYFNPNHPGCCAKRMHTFLTGLY